MTDRDTWRGSTDPRHPARVRLEKDTLQTDPGGWGAPDAPGYGARFLGEFTWCLDGAGVLDEVGSEAVTVVAGSDWSGSGCGWDPGRLDVPASVSTLARGLCGSCSVRIWAKNFESSPRFGMGRGLLGVALLLLTVAKVVLGLAFVLLFLHLMTVSGG